MCYCVKFITKRWRFINIQHNLRTLCLLSTCLMPNEVQPRKSREPFICLFQTDIDNLFLRSSSHISLKQKYKELEYYFPQIINHLYGTHNPYLVTLGTYKRDDTGKSQAGLRNRRRSTMVPREQSKYKNVGIGFSFLYIRQPNKFSNRPYNENFSSNMG